MFLLVSSLIPNCNSDKAYYSVRLPSNVTDFLSLSESRRIGKLINRFISIAAAFSVSFKREQDLHIWIAWPLSLKIFHLPCIPYIFCSNAHAGVFSSLTYHSLRSRHYYTMCHINLQSRKKNKGFQPQSAPFLLRADPR